MNQKTSGTGPYGNDINNLQFIAEAIDENSIHIKITDLANNRWQVPFVIQSESKKQKRISFDQANYHLFIPEVSQTFSFQLISKYGPYTVFNTTGQPFVVCIYISIVCILIVICSFLINICQLEQRCMVTVVELVNQTYMV
jgi:hypothetical protein